MLFSPLTSGSSSPKTARRLALLLVSVGFFVAACAEAAQTTSYPPGTTIEPAQLVQALSNPNPPIVVDVREPNEFAEGHIQGALSVPLSGLPTHFQEIPKDRSVVVYCRSGHRSAKAQAFLEMQGYTNIESMTGGINNWHASLQKGSCSSSHC